MGFSFIRKPEPETFFWFEVRKIVQDIFFEGLGDFGVVLALEDEFDLDLEDEEKKLSTMYLESITDLVVEKLTEKNRLKT